MTVTSCYTVTKMSGTRTNRSVAVHRKTCLEATVFEVTFQWYKIWLSFKVSSTLFTSPLVMIYELTGKDFNSAVNSR